MPLQDSPYPDQPQAFECNRLMLLEYVSSVEPDGKYVDAMSEFANSEFPEIRGQFARCLPLHQVTPDAVEALKRMVFTEMERILRTSAITRLMALHGMNFDMGDALYKSIYLSLRSDDPNEKKLAIRRLESMSRPDCL